MSNADIHTSQNRPDGSVTEVFLKPASETKKRSPEGADDTHLADAITDALPVLTVQDRCCEQVRRLGLLTPETEALFLDKDTASDDPATREGIFTKFLHQRFPSASPEVVNMFLCYCEQESGVSDLRITADPIDEATHMVGSSQEVFFMLRQLASEGQGKTLLVFDPRDREPQVLKTSLKRVSSPDDVTQDDPDLWRFSEERATLSRASTASNPVVRSAVPRAIGALAMVRMYGHDGHRTTVNNHLGFRQEFIPGETLDALGKMIATEREKIGNHGVLTLSARLVLEIARKLTELHRMGIIHRDLKPKNLILGDDGKPKIIDFGLTKSSSGATKTGTGFGTTEFASPEQTLDAKSADDRTDVYSLALVLYSLVKGANFFSSTFNSLSQKRDPAYIRTRLDELQRETACPELCTLLESSLHDDEKVARRPDMHAFSQMLAAIVLRLEKQHPASKPSEADETNASSEKIRALLAPLSPDVLQEYKILAGNAMPRRRMSGTVRKAGYAAAGAALLGLAVAVGSYVFSAKKGGQETGVLQPNVVPKGFTTDLDEKGNIESATLLKGFPGETIVEARFLAQYKVKKTPDNDDLDRGAVLWLTSPQIANLLNVKEEELPEEAKKAGGCDAYGYRLDGDRAVIMLAHANAFLYTKNVQGKPTVFLYSDAPVILSRGAERGFQGNTVSAFPASEAAKALGDLPEFDDDNALGEEAFKGLSREVFFRNLHDFPAQFKPTLKKD